MGYKCVYLNLVHTHKLALTYFVQSVYMCVGAHTHKLQVWHYFKAATA